MNEKGSSLLFVLLIIVIFSLLGLTVLGAAVHNIKRTEYREYEVETTASSKAIMNEIIIALEEKFDPNQNENEEAKTIRNILKEHSQPKQSIYDTTVNQIINDIQSDFSINYSDYTISLTELSEDEYKNYLNIDNIAQFKEENFMRIYNIRIKYNHSESENLPAVYRTIEQNVILSPTPSFLNYAVGVGIPDKESDESDGRLIINGSPDIVGNVFAPTLELNSRAKYVKDDTSYTSGEFFGPSIYGTLFTSQIENNRKTVANETDHYFFEGNFEEDISGIPAIQPLSKYFVDMDFWATYIRKRADADSNIPIPEGFENLDTTSDDIEEKATVPIPVSELTCFDSEHVFYDYLEAGLLSEQHPEETEEFDINKIMEYDEAIRDPDNNTTLAFSNGKNFYLLEESMLETYQSQKNNFFEQVQNTNSIIYFTNIDQRNEDNEPYFYNNYKKSAGTAEIPNVLTIDQSLKLKNAEQEKGWLVVDGTLVLRGVKQSEEDSKEKVEIVGNILVNGDLYIQSEEEDEPEDLYFDSTIYVTGNTYIENVNIHGVEDENGNEKQLVLITNGDLKIVRINEYEDVEEDKSLYNLINNPPNLKAFFYTNQTATLYGVGSLFQIEGGVFARKNLTINAIRGNIDHINEASTAQSFSPENEKNTRFFVEHDTHVLIDQLNALPIVDRLQVIPDKMNISQ